MQQTPYVIKSPSTKRAAELSPNGTVLPLATWGGFMFAILLTCVAVGSGVGLGAGIGWELLRRMDHKQ
ncbi:MAG: hypothetical protein A2600_08970 [Candidatus Lambdaproteobacteria bacterium RIFOXYD1_FULL_56_27]|uniref:Uncharacterized protein n=1 Tax=Candidatus Lambdaproteobacteria bacterium RIFOXYD2_FULL_56_26 TaxID=1817773 RepID=A0A1F6GZ63_9PROT|nr:MAG: hypothetical protein A2426_10390 [Candidatus Lambdaproteobacteria bacterium RIFOXYC1_FULL_56_13]OGH03334.1 MAG: hypothetical protein A2557_02295 [Candidatus Lambdaproteobacteria bacterium RIFOXYD2_FULL_56_26]OGH06661.1 MAG: hypothetical protein A2600_08970 [Candidatus Lambdaproteobacteria bacterium RIFOXYD1_FULL_56_27]